MIKIQHKATIKNGAIIPSDSKRFKADINQYEGKEVSITIEKWIKRRTDAQNRSLWLWFQMLAETLNLKGFDMRAIIREDVEIEWTKDSIANYLWRPLQETMFGSKSTRKLTSEQINQLYDNLNKIISERTNGEVQIPFPSIDELFLTEEDIN